MRDKEIRLGPGSSESISDKGDPAMQPFSVSGDGESEGRTITGYAALFNRRSAKLYDSAGEFFEVIAPNAFVWSDVRALFNHDDNMILARTTSNTLTLEQDGLGLKYSFVTPNTSYGRDLAENIRLRNISQSSFGFITNRDDWHTEKDGTRVRTIVNAELLDVSPVTYPAYVDTSVALRSFNSWQREIKALEEKLNALSEQLTLSSASIAEKDNLIAELQKQLETSKKPDMTGLDKAISDYIAIQKQLIKNQ